MIRNHTTSHALLVTLTAQIAGFNVIYNHYKNKQPAGFVIIVTKKSFVVMRDTSQLVNEQTC